jgi:hypothetical protein
LPWQSNLARPCRAIARYSLQQNHAREFVARWRQMSAPRQVLQVCKVLHHRPPRPALSHGRNTVCRRSQNVSTSARNGCACPTAPAPPSAALELTLRGVHKLRVARDGGGLKIGVENLDTGDMFGRTVVPGDLVALVPEHARCRKCRRRLRLSPAGRPRRGSAGHPGLAKGMPARRGALAALYDTSAGPAWTARAHVPQAQRELREDQCGAARRAGADALAVQQPRILRRRALSLPPGSGAEGAHNRCWRPVHVQARAQN